MERTAVAHTWLIIVLAGLLTFAIRLSFIALHGRWQPPALFQRALRYVPPAVLSAIILPEMLLQDGQMLLSPLNPRLLAGIVAILIAWRTRSTLLTILAGMLALYLLQWALG
ncbi:MAG: AzlD domain-containing protein [Chloroflexota bacterium]|jgi:branched-subunit amino acid transport protein